MLFLLAALAASCSSYPEYTASDHLYFAGKHQALVDAYSGASEDLGPNALLGRMKALSALLAARDWDRAEATAIEVSTAVNIYLANQEGERDALSTFGRERDKPFKGEPHEQAMADYYLGLLRFRRGDYEGALSCFRSALNKDRGSFVLPVEGSDERDETARAQRYLYDADWAMFQLLAARCWQHLEELEEASRYADRAKASQSALAPIVDLGVARESNVFVILDVGHAPLKSESGPKGAVLTYIPPKSTVVESVSLNGKSLSFGVTDDLFYQASTLGGRNVDELNKVKAQRQAAVGTAGVAATTAGMVMTTSRDETVRTAGLATMLAGIAAMIFAEAAIDPRADTRSWNLLPGSLALAVGSAAPGKDHRLRIAARGGGASRRYVQEWTSVPVHEDRDTLLYVRVLPQYRGGPWESPPARESERNEEDQLEENVP